MPINEELRRLCGQIDALTDADMFNAMERAKAVSATAKRVLVEFDARLQRIEKLYENVEPHRRVEQGTE